MTKIDITQNTEEVFTGEINEFTDWVTGNNTLTGGNDTEGLPVSGGSIRKFLQQKAAHPMHLELDTSDAKYKIFSSPEACDLWKSNKEAYANLVLYEFQGPADYVINVASTPAKHFVKKSDSASVHIDYTWSISSGASEASAASARVRVETIINNRQGILVAALPAKIYEIGETAGRTDDIYLYLSEGTNFVVINMSTVDGKDSHGKAFAASGSASVIVELVNMSLTTDFKNFESMPAEKGYGVVATLDKSTSSDATLYVYIDGVQKDSYVFKGAGHLQLTIPITIPSQEGPHRLDMYAVTSDDSGTTSIYSNLLHYDFVTSVSDPSYEPHHLLIAHSFQIANSDEKDAILNNNLRFKAKQYEQFELEWGHYAAGQSSVEVTWKLESVDRATTDTLPVTIGGPYRVASDVQGPTVKHMPNIDGECVLVGYIKNTEICRYNMSIAKGADVYEVPAYAVKLSAYGKTNEVNAGLWLSGTVKATFSPSVNFTPTNGWYDNSLRLSGVSNYADINFMPFSANNVATDGSFTFEIEFFTEYVNNSDDILFLVGNMIKITPNMAVLCDSSGAEVVKTNFKSNERIKLAFIVNGSDAAHGVDKELAFICNNGILERGAKCSQNRPMRSSATMHIGGSTSGIRVYSIRHYARALTYDDAYNNYVFDAVNKSQILSNNNVLSDGKININQCASKLDVIVIEGDLTNVLNKDVDKDQSFSTVKIERRCNYDSSRNFTITNGAIRKHGQSTLNYPIASFKIWSNKPADKDVNTLTTTMEWLSNPGFGKNRYQMKLNSIPANKWVLQANYADSSGVHNGGLQRLINDTWYNAKVDNEYKLRTPPQLFATNQTITYPGSEKDVINGYNSAGKKITEYSNYKNGEFPYPIRVSADSFPCVVFYRNTVAGETEYTFLGQYVFMEDKKSDFCTGERSMYNVVTPNNIKDPFCLFAVNNKADTKENKMWDNNCVLRIEVLSASATKEDNNYASYKKSGDGFDAILTKDIFDNDGNKIGESKKFAWEEEFEMIYPDPDDLETDDTRFLEGSKFRTTVQPFVDFYKWVQSTKGNIAKFKAEAHQHLDLYKIAAYYIFCIRFGLVDSMERNAQIKTYDGKHFWYEPWDMDIALGNRNTGGIAFNPPIDRNTVEAGSVEAGQAKYALSGPDNTLWNNLEGWSEWMNKIVPDVAQALTEAGLTYDSVTEMFDNNYQNAWCETIYNKSGHFKYVESNTGGNSDEYLPWLQGARTTHRHWWLKTSMDYWDAKWACGDFRNHSIYIGANKPTGQVAKLGITASSKTFFNWAKNYAMSGDLKEAVADESFVYDLTAESFSVKEPFSLYGTLYAKELDLSCFAAGISIIRLSGAYSPETGSNLKKLSIGNTLSSDGTVVINNTQLTIQDLGLLEALEDYNITGLHNLVSTEFTAPAKLINFYAAGSNITAFSSSEQGNDFGDIHLPDTTTSLKFNDSSWTNLKFYKLAMGLKVTETSEDEDGNEVITEYYTNSKVVESSDISKINKIILSGSTSQEQCAKDLVFSWLDKILLKKPGEGYMNCGYEWPDEIKHIEALRVNWTNLTYEQVKMLAAAFGYESNRITGYISVAATEEIGEAEILQLVNWFGDTVFNLGYINDKLVVDYPLYGESMSQIVLGSPAYSIGGETYVNEADHAENGELMVRLRYVKFKLENTDQDVTWRMRGSSSDVFGDTYRGCKIVEREAMYDDGKIYYLSVPESSNGNYNIELQASYADGSSSATKIIHINAVTFPQLSIVATDITTLINTKDLHIRTDIPQIENKDGVLIEGNLITIQKGNIGLRFAPKSTVESTACVSSYSWSITGTNYSSYMIVDQDAAKQYFDVTTTVVPDDSVSCTLTLTVVFKSGKIMQATKNINLFNDILVVDNANLYLMEMFLKKGYSAPYYLSTVGKIQSMGFLASTQGNACNLTAKTGQVITNYMPQLKSLSFEGNTGVNYSVIDWSVIANTLTTLNIKNAASYNLSSITLPNVTSFTANGTTSNVSVSNKPNFVTCKLGKPSSVELISTGVTNSSFTIDDKSNVLTFVFKNNNSYTADSSHGAFHMLLDIISAQS